jgi:hypothetical protein
MDESSQLDCWMLEFLEMIECKAGFWSPLARGDFVPLR